MKTTLTFSSLFLSMISSAPAFSMHNYFSETCRMNLKKEEIVLYKEDYWDGHHFILNSDIPGVDDYPSVYLPGEEGSENDKISGDEGLVFSDIKDGRTIETPYDDGCWKGFNAEFTRSAKVVSASSPIQNILQIHSGDTVTMKCSYEHLVIMGDACDQR